MFFIPQKQVSHFSAVKCQRVSKYKTLWDNLWQSLTNVNFKSLIICISTRRFSQNLYCFPSLLLLVKVIDVLVLECYYGLFTTLVVCMVVEQCMVLLKFSCHFRGLAHFFVGNSEMLFH